MKDLFNKIRPDKGFNLETVSFEELFEGLKEGFALAIGKFSKCEVQAEDLKLNVDRCSIRRAYALDGNLYPKIYLDLKGEYGFLINPFEIQMIAVKNGVDTLLYLELLEALYNFMCDRFPNSDYARKFEKYLVLAEKSRIERDLIL